MAKKYAAAFVPDNLYRVLYYSRFANNNCRAVSLSKGNYGVAGYIQLDCLTFDTGMENIYVVPESKKDKFEEILEKDG